jgi:hypothetical protein
MIQAAVRVKPLRILLALYLGCTSVGADLATGARHFPDVQALRPPAECRTDALAPAPDWMLHALQASADRVRQWIEPPRAWAGDYPVRRPVWDFEPAERANQPARMNMADANPDAGVPRSGLDPAIGARALLENLRRSPMRRGSMEPHKRPFQVKLANAISDQGVLSRLAERMAFQLLLKFPLGALGDEATWRAIGTELRQDTERLRTGLELTDRQIVTVLPKLSAEQVESLARDLEGSDPQIARTILNAAINAAEPVAASGEFLRDYNTVVQALADFDPKVARTLANAAFKNADPAQSGLVYVQRFRSLFEQFRHNVAFARSVARTACRAANPLQVARDLVSDYNQIVKELTEELTKEETTEPDQPPNISKTLAEVAILSATPIPTAHWLLAKFKDVRALAKKTHPSIASSIALNACRAADPFAAAQLYMNNYDEIVRVISLTDLDLAHEVASQAFRSDNPLPWAKRYLAQLKASRPKWNLTKIVVPFIVAVGLLWEQTGDAHVDACGTRLIPAAA